MDCPSERKVGRGLAVNFYLVIMLFSGVHEALGEKFCPREKAGPGWVITKGGWTQGHFEEGR